jgi:hypothetical protein
MADNRGERMVRHWQKTATPAQWPVREIGRIVGCTNPESCELGLDGETLIFGNCTMITGHPAYFSGPGLVYVQGAAFVSRGRITPDAQVRLEERVLVGALSSTLAVDFLRVPTKLFPRGTAFIATGGRPIAKRNTQSLVEDPGEIRQQALAFDPQSGIALGRIPLWRGSRIADRFNYLDQPNGLALDSRGNLYVGDIPNGNPDGTAAVPSAVYRIPHEALDDLAQDRPAAAAGVERVLIPAAVNGVTVAPDDTVRAVSCSPHDPIEGGIYRLTRENFATGKVSEPSVTGLGILDGVGVTRRGTEICSNPVTGQIHALLQDGSHRIITLDGRNPVASPADINVCYPLALKGEPALLVPDIMVGSAPGEGVVLVLDISGL